MPRTIVVPLDGSTPSEKAIPYAMILAQKSGATLTFMRAILTASELAGARAFNEGLLEETSKYLETSLEAA
jgi:nucleotide-binding universal stress UspA family protein